ncbi:hypothetical protein KJ742_03290 [Patescibacteria group bacterium]|nr:hypothetical protein [Patescibacteria group bacterium]MBU1682945.1 hypothetical protein [Patescibacteria group bacterium]MBU1935690.1 hypothetical protein [Patescibacteria group bacterium]
MTKLSKSILGTIKKNKIQPRSRWQFVLLHVLLWVALATSVVLGSLAISVILRVITGVDWEIVRYVGNGAIHSFMLVLPYIWIAILGLIMFLATMLFEKTKKGYRYSPVMVVITSVVISLLFGSGLYFVGVGHSVDTALAESIPPYATWKEKRDGAMVVPDRGALVGRIINLMSDEQIMMIDFKGTKWTVDITDAEFKDDFRLQLRQSIGVLGEKIDEDEFKAKRIMLWKPPVRPEGKMRPPTPPDRFKNID